MPTAANYKLSDFSVCLYQFRNNFQRFLILAQTFYNVIDNQLTTTAKTRRAVNPSTEQVLADVPISTQEDVDRAVAAAQAALPSWRDLSQDDRGVYLNKLVDSIDSHQQEFAKLLGEETGKPPQAVGLELFLLSHQIRQTLNFRLAEEQIEDTEDVCSLLHGSLLWHTNLLLWFLLKLLLTRS